MCGRFVVLTADELRDVVDAVEGRAAARALRADAARGEAFPGSSVTAIRRAGEKLAVDGLHWGFPAEWSKGTVFNTRLESALADSPMWRDAIREGRCIIPAAAFYEPHRTEKATSPRTGKPIKRPYLFHDKNGMPLLFAGVASQGNCSIVTCEPNRWVAPVHPRMPLALRFEEVPLWLEGGLPDLGRLADRSGIELTSSPELELANSESDNPEPDQLMLF